MLPSFVITTAVGPVQRVSGLIQSVCRECLINAKSPPGSALPVFLLTWSACGLSRFQCDRGGGEGSGGQVWGVQEFGGDRHAQPPGGRGRRRQAGDLVAGHVPCYKMCILSWDMCPVTKHASCRRTHPVAKQASYHRTCILLQNMHPVAGHTPYCKTCILSKDVHPVEEYASCWKTGILLLNMHPVAGHASCCKMGILSKDVHPVKGHASCQSVENKEVCFCVCVCGWSTSLSHLGNPGCFTLVSHSSCKSSATHSCQ